MQLKTNSLQRSHTNCTENVIPYYGRYAERWNTNLICRNQKYDISFYLEKQWVAVYNWTLNIIESRKMRKKEKATEFSQFVLLDVNRTKHSHIILFPTSRKINRMHTRIMKILFTFRWTKILLVLLFSLHIKSPNKERYSDEEISVNANKTVYYLGSFYYIAFIFINYDGISFPPQNIYIWERDVLSKLSCSCIGHLSPPYIITPILYQYTEWKNLPRSNSLKWWLWWYTLRKWKLVDGRGFPWWR